MTFSTLRPLAAALLVVAAMAGAVLPLAAKDVLPDGQRKERSSSDRGQGGVVIVPRGGGKESGSGMVICSANGAELLAGIFGRIEGSVAFTPEQESLFEAFRATALVAQADYVAACTAAMSEPDPEREPDLAERLRLRATLDTARIATLNAVLPSFEALYESLDDSQRAQLQPSVPAESSRGTPVIEPRVPRSIGPYDA